MLLSIPRRSTRYDPLMRIHNRENIDWYNGWAEATEALWVRYCITQCPKACQDGFGLYRIIQGLIVLRCAPSASGFPLHVSQNQHQRHAARPALGSVVWNGGMYAHSHAFALWPRTLFKACSGQGPADVCFKCPPPRSSHVPCGRTHCTHFVCGLLGTTLTAVPPKAFVTRCRWSHNGTTHRAQGPQKKKTAPIQMLSLGATGEGTRALRVILIMMRLRCNRQICEPMSGAD